MQNDPLTPALIGIWLAIAVVLGIQSYYLASMYRDLNRLAILGQAWYTSTKA